MHLSPYTKGEIMQYCYLFFFSVLLSCSTESLPDGRQLDFFGEFDNTEVVFIVNGSFDTLHFGIDFFQLLHGRYDFDTTLLMTAEKARISKLLSLEKPAVINFRINEFFNEIFILPGQPVTIHCAVGPDNVTIHYEDELHEDINKYYARKAALTGGLHGRYFYGYEILRSDISFEQILANFDSMKLLFNTLLDESAGELALPDWFVQYEKKCIDYRDMQARIGAPSIRRLRGISDQNEPWTAPDGIDEIDLNDEEGLLTEEYLDLIFYSLRAEIDPLEYQKLTVPERLQLRIERAKKIQNQIVRDIFYCREFLMMQLTSHPIPDTLVNQLGNAISDDMQPYVLKLEKNLASLEGKTAPSFHLKNPKDELVTLSDFRGNIVLLDFWFIGCPGCKEELPYDRKLVDNFQHKPFTLIKVCMKSDKKKWLDMQDELSGINLFSNEAWDGKLTKSYQLKGFPRYVLIDKDGKVIDGWCERPSDPVLMGRLRELVL